jgi:hypothetical protein
MLEGLCNVYSRVPGMYGMLLASDVPLSIKFANNIPNAYK